MYRLNNSKFPFNHFTFLVLLLLLFSPTSSSWCFQEGDVTVIPETLFTNSHSIPSTCVTSTSILIEQNNRETPIECNGCLDLVKEEITSTGTQDHNSEFVITPSTAHIQPQSVESLGLSSSLISVSHLYRPLKTRFNLHSSIHSTILII